jgi:hypothetical protein
MTDSFCWSNHPACAGQVADCFKMFRFKLQA